MSPYSEKMRRLVAELPNLGDLPDATHRGLAENPVCDDRAMIWLRISGGVVEAARFRAEGCPAALGAVAGLTEMLKGIKVEEIHGLGVEELVTWLGGLPQHKRHGAELALAALAAALEQGGEPRDQAPRAGS